MEKDMGEKQTSHLEALVTEWETEQIIRWGIRPLPDLVKDLPEIELFLKRELAEFDRVKLHILLGECYAASGKVECAREHAKALRNMAILEIWAESLIRKLSEDKDGDV